MTSTAILPDLLRPGLNLVFCGTAAGTVSALRGHYYAHPQNKFWRTLHAVGLTPALIAPKDYPTLLDHGIGLTDLAKHVSGMDSQLPPGSLRREAVADLRGRIERCAPAILAFTSLTGGRKFAGPRAAFGPHAEMIGPTRVWILPSPSPAAHWNWNEEVWRALADEAKKS
jgi:TDG/mug DNA glycosylase family protein